MSFDESYLRRIQEHDPEILGEHRWRTHAVLVPMIRGTKPAAPKTTDWEIVFEIRSHDLDHQPGEICFPGGRKEPCDGTPRQTAIRETVEELGIPRESIHLLGELDRLVMPWKTVIYPFTAILRAPERITPDPGEVAECFSIPMKELLSTEPDIHYLSLEPSPEEGFPYDKIPRGRDYPWKRGRQREPFYHVRDRVIWGLTARILEHFIDVVRGEHAD